MYGQAIAKLLPRIGVFVCQEARVGFAFSTQLWYQIAYWRNAWLYGWVAGEDLKDVGKSGASGWHLGLANASAAQPAETPTLPRGTEAPAASVAPLPQPQQPPKDVILAPPAPPAAEPVESRVDHRLLWRYYLATAFVLLLGIAAKLTIDIHKATKGKELKAKALEFVSALLIPFLTFPLVLLAFVQTVQVAFGSTDIQSQLIFFLLAFQSGYFWETVTREKS